MKNARQIDKIVVIRGERMKKVDLFENGVMQLNSVGAHLSQAEAMGF